MKVFRGSVTCNGIFLLRKSPKSVSRLSWLWTDVTGVIPLVVRGAVWRVVKEIVALLVVAVSKVSYPAVFGVCLAAIVRLLESVRFLLAALIALLLLGFLGGLLFGFLTPLPLHASVLEPDFYLPEVDCLLAPFNWWNRGSVCVTVHKGFWKTATCI